MKFKIALLLSMTFISFHSYSETFPQIGYEPNTHQELSISKYDARDYKINEINKSINENLISYRKSLKEFESNKSKFEKLKNMKKIDEDTLYSAKSNFLKSRKSVNYYLGNIYYLEGHLYDLQHKEIKNKVVGQNIMNKLSLN